VYDLRSNERSFNVGDLVHLLDTSRKIGQCPKLNPVWKGGPYVVGKKMGPVLYQIQDRKSSKVVHHDRFKAYLSDCIPLWVTKVRRECESTITST
jgi:hypothetical protein